MRLIGWKSWQSIKRCGVGADIITYLRASTIASGGAHGAKSIDAGEENHSEFKRIPSRVSMVSSKDHLPYYAAGKVVKGFGRGSKSLGCPTANLPEEVVEALPAEFETGVYYGWVSLEKQVYKMVMSIGWNPFYNNDKKSMEIHLIHNFENDFYGKELKAVILEYIRPETNFSSVDELIKAIQNDIDVAKKSLDQPSMAKYKQDPFLIS